MYIQKTLTILKNTPVNSPLVLEIPLMQGLIERIEVTIIKGCEGLVGLQIWDKGKIIVPLGNPNEWLIGEDKIYDLIDFNYQLDTLPWSLNLVSYNLDDTFNHSPIIGFYINPGFTIQSSGNFY